MEIERQRLEKKKLVVLRSERDFYSLIEQRLKEAGFELLNIFKETSRRNSQQASYLDGPFHT